MTLASPKSEISEQRTQDPAGLCGVPGGCFVMFRQCRLRLGATEILVMVFFVEKSMV